MTNRRSVRRPRLSKAIASAFLAACVGGAFSYLLLLVLYNRVWRMNGHLPLIYLSLHVVLMTLLLTLCSGLRFNPNSFLGILTCFAIAIVGSLLVIVLGGFPAFLLLYTGLAFSTSFAATLVFVLLRLRAHSPRGQ